MIFENISKYWEKQTKKFFKKICLKCHSDPKTCRKCGRTVGI
jgi:ribosomal protein L40E